jgi:hypothetical protein
MSDESTAGRGVEKAVYLVGGLGLGLFGIQDLVNTAVSVYSGTYNPSGRTLDIAPPTWAGWTAGIVVGVLFLLGGAYLLIRARRLGSTKPTNVPRPMANAQ